MRLLLADKKEGVDLLSSQKFEVKDENGETVFSFDMGLASQIYEDYRLASVQEYIWETYFDYEYTFEETARLARRVIEVMDEAFCEAEACEYVLFQEEPKYRDYARENGIDPSLIMTQRIVGLTELPEGFEFADFDYNVYTEPFHAAHEGEDVQDEYTYDEAIRLYGPKKVDAFLTALIEMDAEAVKVFEEMAERIECLEHRIYDMHIDSCIVDGIDREKRCVNVIVRWVNDRGDIRQTVELCGIYSDGKAQLMRESGVNYIDHLEELFEGTERFIRTGSWEKEVAV